MNTDTWNVRLVIVGLIAICLVALVLGSNGTAPAYVGNVAAAALGGLTGILATTRSTDGQPPQAPFPTGEV